MKAARRETWSIVSREYLHGDYLLLYVAMETIQTVYLLSIRHHRQLTFDFSAHWPS